MRSEKVEIFPVELLNFNSLQIGYKKFFISITNQIQTHKAHLKTSFLINWPMSQSLPDASIPNNIQSHLLELNYHFT